MIPKWTKKIGTTWDIAIPWRDSSGAYVSSYTSAKGWFSLKSSATIADGSGELEVTSDSGEVTFTTMTIDGTSVNIMRVVIAAAATAALTAGTYRAFAQVKLSGGHVEEFPRDHNEWVFEILDSGIDATS